MEMSIWCLQCIIPDEEKSQMDVYYVVMLETTKCQWFWLSIEISGAWGLEESPEHSCQWQSRRAVHYSVIPAME